MKKWISITILLICLSTCLVWKPVEASNLHVDDVWVRAGTRSLGGTTYYNMCSVSPPEDQTGFTKSKAISCSYNWPKYKLCFCSAWPLTDVKFLNQSTWTVTYRTMITADISIDQERGVWVKVVMANGTVRETLGDGGGGNYDAVAATGWFTLRESNGWVTKTGTWTCPDYEVVNQSDYLAVYWRVRGEADKCGYTIRLRNDENTTTHSATEVCYIQNVKWTEAGPPSKYYFNFNHTDLDAGDVDGRVSWQLHNGSGQISYTEGEATLQSGNYTLKTYRYGYLINETSLTTASYGNSTVDLTMQMKPHSHTAGGYVTSNTTISSIAVDEQTAINLTFTITAATPCLLIVDVGGEPDNATKDGSPFSDYTYTTSPSKHLKMELSSLSTFMFTWDSPPEQEGGQETSGASGGEPWKNRLWVTVLYEGEVLHLANVSVEGGKEAIWGLTNIFGEVKFFLPKGSFTVTASHEDYGSVSRDVLLEDDLEVEMDIARGSPLTVFPSIDLGEIEMGVLILPVLIFVIYAFSLALRKPTRKYRYSYLK